MPSRRTILVAALLVVAALLGAYFGGFLSLAPIDYNPNTVVLYTDSLGTGDASSFFPSGHWTDPSSDQKQMLDAPQYITSWKSTGNSEGLVPIADIVYTVGVIKNAHWKYYVSTGGAWDLVKDTPASSPSGIILGGKFVIPPPDPLYYFTGEINGWTRVELNLEWWSPGPNVADGDWVNDLRHNGPVLRDDAVLASGRGTITSPRDLALVEVGQTITATVDVGSACSKKASPDGSLSAGSGYTLELSSEAQGQTVKTWDIGCGPGTTSKDAGGNPLAYTASSSDISGTKRKLVYKLFNDLFQKDQNDVKTIEVGTSRLTPPTLKFEAAGGTWEEGDTVTVTIVTTETGVLYNIVVENIGSGARVLDVDRSTKSVHTFTPTVAGSYRVAASIEKSDGSAFSEPTEEVLLIKEGTPPDFCKVNPTAPECQAEEPFVLPLWLILLIIGVTAILVAWLLPFIPIFPWKFVIIAVGGILVLVAVFVFPR